MQLYKHQQNIVDKDPKRSLLAWECGTGKSLAAMKLCKDNFLVICPKSIKQKWKDEIKTFLGDVTYEVYTKEEFRKNHARIRGCAAVIVDEAHFFSNSKSQMHKSLRYYLKRCQPDRAYLLTATPYMSTPWNIYALASILGNRWDWHKFREFFFYKVTMGNRDIWMPKDDMEEDVAKLVKRIGDSVKMEECFDIPEQIDRIEWFTETKEQARETMNYLLEIPIVYYTKVHQICGGRIKDHNRYIKSEKFERLKELLNLNKKIIVVSRYSREIEMIKKSLAGKRDVLVIDGGTKDKYATSKEAEEKENCVVLINSSAAEGYELPSFPVMIFYSLDFSLKNYIQVKGRILRANKLKKNVYIHMVVRDTVDEAVYDSLLRKKDFHVEIYAKENPLDVVDTYDEVMKWSGSVDVTMKKTHKQDNLV
jgi:superfamily II DNA or RNA helicase|tara:strand:- start:1973 stop:3238 length:1266 start_codon:yes stop_codon:yes gene_type:complete